MFIFASKKTVYASQLFEKLKNRPNESWYFITDKSYFNNLNISITQKLEIKDNITKIFFFHWNYIVPKSIYNYFECINIHTSNLPDGKGGSPLQNQILDDIVISKVNTLRMSDNGLDAGPIYCSQNITLQGNLSDIWYLLSQVSFNLISKIIDENIIPVEQPKGEFINYKRRKDNQIPFESANNLKKIYDFIRMLDDDNYPSAHLIIGQYKLNFNRANFNGEKIHADVIIEKLN